MQISLGRLCTVLARLCTCFDFTKDFTCVLCFCTGVHDLVYDKLTEYPDTINILERMNIYQEVILAALYRILPAQLQVSVVISILMFCLNSLCNVPRAKVLMYRQAQ